MYGRTRCATRRTAPLLTKDNDMGDKGGRKDKGKKELRKKALLSPKEKRKAKAGKREAKTVARPTGS